MSSVRPELRRGGGPVLVREPGLEALLHAPALRMGGVLDRLGGRATELLVDEPAHVAGQVEVRLVLVVRVAERPRIARGEDPGLAGRREERLRADRATEEDVVVEVEVVLGQPREVVQLADDRAGVEDGQHGRVGEDVAV